jgi:hypothetical protein
MKLQRLNVVDYVISSSEYSGSKLYATNPISLEFLSITEFQKWYYCFDSVEQVNGNGWSDFTDKGKMEACVFCVKFKINKI